MTGGSRCTSEPLLTMDEQVRVAGDVAAAVTVPLVADGGAGFGEPLHTMRSVREFIRAGVAGIHIEDQLYPKRAHYHKYVAHVTPREEFVAKIDYACRQRAESDPDFVIIARSDACRFEGLQEAVDRINLAADVGADMGLVFPRNHEELRQAPKLARVPLVYVMSRGNRDQRPLPTIAELEAIGYKACIDAVTSLVVAFTAMKRAFAEIRETGTFTGLSAQECIDARQQIEDLVGLEQFYALRRKRSRRSVGASARGYKPRDYERPPLSRAVPDGIARVLASPLGTRAGCLLADAPPNFPCVAAWHRRGGVSGSPGRNAARGTGATAIFPLRLAWSCGAVDLEPSMTDATFADPDGDLGLPGWVYSNPRFFAAEKERVLAPSWQVVCHLNDIPSAGDCHTFDFIGESIVVVRGRDGFRAPSAMFACTVARDCSMGRPPGVAPLSVRITPGATTWRVGSWGFRCSKPIRTCA